MKTFDIALIGSGGPLATALLHGFTAAGFSVITYGRTRLPSTSLHVDSDLTSLEGHFRAPYRAKVVVFNAAIKGRFTPETSEWIHQGRITAPDFFALFSSLRLEGQRLLTIGSSEEYGPQTDDRPIREDRTLAPRSSYGHWKTVLFQHARDWSEKTDRPHLHLRPFNVFGPGSDSKMLIGSLIQALLEDLDFPMTAAEQWRSFICLETFVRTLTCVIRRPQWEDLQRAHAMNVSEPHYLRLRDVAEMIQSLIGRGQLQIGALPYRADEVWHQKPNLDLMERLLGEHFALDFREEIRKTISFHQRSP